MPNPLSQIDAPSLTNKKIQRVVVKGSNKGLKGGIGQDIKDVLTGRAALQGIKTIAKGVGNIYKNASSVEQRHAAITGFKGNKMQTSDGFMYTK